jgi:hypothetical protein
LNWIWVVNINWNLQYNFIKKNVFEENPKKMILKYYMFAFPIFYIFNIFINHLAFQIPPRFFDMVTGLHLFGFFILILLEVV